VRVAVLTPLPPTKTGVAHYASMLLPALGVVSASGRPLANEGRPEAHTTRDVRAFATLDGYRRADFDEVIYQLGNNPYHEPMYAEAMREPGVVVLHDLVLHHLIVEMTLARGDAPGYVAALEANHGAAGAAWARGRAAGMHTEMANFLMPASVEVANRSKSVIVHNRYAADRLRSLGVTTPIHVVPHPYIRETRAFDRDAIRARLGLTGKRVIGFFGFLTSAKRAEVVLEAFSRANDPSLALLIVGEPAPNIELPRGPGIVSTGYVADEDFPTYYAAADRFVNLRYPSAGETSGTLIRALDAGKPVAVSDYAQFAEFPDDCAFKVPLGAGEVERLVEFFTAELPDVSRAQRRWLEDNARVELTVDGYLKALECGGLPPLSKRPQAAALQSVPLFPSLRLTGNTLTNTGRETILTRTYGQPELRIVDGDRWLPLPCDLHPGESVELDVSAEGPIYLALQGIPFVELPRVR
jgi:glycosyltransferase involved in cell wall biosynthesis